MPDNQVSRRAYLATAATLLGGGCIGVPVEQPRPDPAGADAAGNPRPITVDMDPSEQYYQNGPPERTGRTINATDYPSLQAAHDDGLTPDRTLRVPADGGPYDPLSISKNHITIESRDGAVIEQSNRDDWALGSSSPNRTRDTELTQPVAGGGAKQDGVSNGVGDTALRVADSSSFSPGDDIYLLEETRPYSDPRSGGAKGPDVTEEFRTVVDVDHNTNTLLVHYPMFLPFPTENRTIVGHVEWTATDVRLTGLNVRGTGSSDGTHLVEFVGIKNGWFDNIRVEDSPNASVAITDCYQCRTHKIDCINGHGYGITIRGSVHTYCTETLGDGIINYTVRAGASTTDVLADGLLGRNYQSSPSPVCASHWGGFYVTYKGVTAEDQLTRYRTRQMIIDGFSATDCSGTDVVFSQRPFDVLLRNGSIGGYPSDANEIIFYFRLRGDSQAGGGNRFGNEMARNIHIENVEIEQLGDYGPEDIGNFDENARIDGLYINGLTYGDQPVTEEHVRSWNRFNQATVNNLVVE